MVVLLPRLGTKEERLMKILSSVFSGSDKSEVAVGTAGGRVMCTGVQDLQADRQVGRGAGGARPQVQTGGSAYSDDEAVCMRTLRNGTVASSNHICERSLRAECPTEHQTRSSAVGPMRDCYSCPHSTEGNLEAESS